MYRPVGHSSVPCALLPDHVRRRPLVLGADELAQLVVEDDALIDADDERPRVRLRIVDRHVDFQDPVFVTHMLRRRSVPQIRLVSSLAPAVNDEGNWEIYSKPATGAGEMMTVLKQPLDQTPTSYAPDGTLLFQTTGPQTGTDLWLLPPNGKPSAWLATGAEEVEGRFSPDGRVVAYSSNESGRFEVYVQSRENPADRTQVSVDGGQMPTWSSNGDRLFFRQGNVMMEAAIRTMGGLSAGAPARIFDGEWTLAQWFPYDVLPGGQRFLMVEQSRGAVPTRIDVVLNWSTTLKDRMRQ